MMRRRKIKQQALNLLTLLFCSASGVTLQLQSSAYADNNRPIFRSNSGDTTFAAVAQSACAGQVVWYNTRYQEVTYQGSLWVESPVGSDCEGGRGRMLRGYFEERSAGNEWCRGRLTLYLTNDPRGGSYVRWNEITAVPGYSCAGAGMTPVLTLEYHR